MNAEQLAADAVPRAMRLVGAVHDGTPDDTTRILTGLDADEARALVVVLAAMVDPDKTASDLLGWLGYDPATHTPAHRHRRPLAPHLALALDEILRGTPWTVDQVRDAHAAYSAGGRDWHICQGQRLYDKAAHASRRSREQAS